MPSNLRAHYIETEQVSNSNDELHLFVIGSSSKPQPIKCQVLIEGKPITMEVDTGAEVSLIPEGTLFPSMQPAQSSAILKTYTEEVMPVVSELQVNVHYGEQTKRLRLIIVAGMGASLMGRDRLQYLKLDWHSIHQTISATSDLHSLLTKYSNLFKDELGTVTTYKATLQVQPDTTPKFHKARPILFAIKDTIGAEQNHLEGERILQRVSHSDWAAPIVAIPKKDGRFRICEDYSVCQWRTGCRPVSLTKAYRSFCYTGWRSNLHKTGPLSSLPAVVVR